MTLLQIVNKLWKNNLEQDWKPELEKYNLLYDLETLYAQHKDNRKPNIIVSFIAFAYSKESTWLVLNSDRNKNKNRIMTSIAGENWRADLDFLQAVIGKEKIYASIIDWHLEEQKDSQWSTMLACYDFHSKAQILSMKATTSAELSDVINILKMAEERKTIGDDIKRNLKGLYVNLDNALEQEGRESFSDAAEPAINFMSHEEHIRKRNEERDKARNDARVTNGETPQSPKRKEAFDIDGFQEDEEYPED